jgi:hypothetical protein
MLDRTTVRSYTAVVRTTPDVHQVQNGQGSVLGKPCHTPSVWWPSNAIEVVQLGLHSGNDLTCTRQEMENDSEQ